MARVRVGPESAFVLRQEIRVMHDGFKSQRAVLWLGGIAVLVLGFLVAAIVLPAATPTPGTGGPDIHVPKMQNVPAEGAPKVKLEVDEKKPADEK